MQRLKVLGTVEEYSEEQLSAFERDLGCCLPVDYRSFLHSTGSGIAGPDNRFIDARAHPALKDSVLIDQFLTLSEVRQYRDDYHARIPDWMLPIGSNVFGDLVCLSLSGEAPGVFYWDHEQEESAYEILAELLPVGHTATFRIASSFSSFAQMLTNVPDL
jgi:hypothetical protein